MNGSKSPDATARDGPPRDQHVTGMAQSNGAGSPRQMQNAPKAPLMASIEGQDTELPDAPTSGAIAAPAPSNGDHDDVESEAETLIDSPVKKKEADKQHQAAIKSEPKSQPSRIGGLPVPGDDDDDVESAESPMISTENATPAVKDDDAQIMDEGEGSDRDAEGSDSEELSSPQSDEDDLEGEEDAEGEEDEDVERSGHERGDLNGTDSPNPRKRKHRASSASLPNSKRRSMDPPKRRLRGMHSDADVTGLERSSSPKPRGHRRAISTQSALDRTSEGAVGRKRKAETQYPVKEPKSATGRSAWEESDASSETASRGQPDEQFKRPQRGVGRSTSTPGRPGGREHKRHVNKYGFTKLAEACEEGKLEMVKEWREKDADSLELAEFAGNKPLQIAALNGNAEVVAYLIDEGCQIDCANLDQDTPLIDAAENGHIEVVRLLLEAGVDPLKQNLKGQQALDVVTDDTDDAPQIRAALHKAIDTWNSSSARQKREEEEEIRHRAGPSKELHFMARTYENLLRLVANNDRNGVREFMAARVPVDNAVIAMAAKTGDVYLVNMLLAEMSEKKARQRAEKPMLAVLGSSHWEMVQALTELETFDPTYRDRQGRDWPAIAEERGGPMWRQEVDLLRRLYDQRASNMKSLGRRSSSPVSRRDGGGKRFLRQPNAGDKGPGGDSLVDVRRKNGRRLMSRKDMRAASGKALSDSSDENEDADSEGEADDDEAVQSTMGPPDTPARIRAAGRTRSKSAASQVSDASPNTRRRSSSLRDPRSGESGLPALAEAPEHAATEAEVKTEDKQKAEEAKFALEQAQRLAAKQKEEAEAEAEAKRAEEAEKARLRAEEQRKAEEDRRRQEAQEAERARQKAAEAEAERQRQLRRDKEAAEAREAREKRKKELLASLPPSLRHVLHPESEFTYEGLEEKAYLVQSFTPLQVVRATGEEWVLNLQAAALVGKETGLEMLGAEGQQQQPQQPYFTLEALGSDARERGIVKEILAEFPTTAKSDADATHDAADDFDAELERAAERLNTLAAMKRNFLLSKPPDSDTTPLRLVRLTEVRAKLHPLLRDVNLEIESPPPPSQQYPTANGPTGDDGSIDVFQGMKKLFETRPAAQGALGVVEGWTEVGVVHEK